MNNGINQSNIKSRNDEVKEYDFRRPDKFQFDQLRTLQLMHEAYARLNSVTFSAMLRLQCHMKVEFVEQKSFEEFIRSLAYPTVLSINGMEPLKGTSLMEISPVITHSVINRITGGKGSNMENQELTDIELSVMYGVFSKLLENLKISWSNVIGLEPMIRSIETRPQNALIVPPNAMVITVSTLLNIGKVEGRLNLCYPYITLEPIMPKLSAKYWYSGIKMEKPDNIRIAAGAKAESKFCITGDKLSVRELLRMKKGTLIRLPGYEKGKVVLNAGGQKAAQFKQNKIKTGKRYELIIDEDHNSNILEFENILLEKQKITDQNNPILEPLKGFMNEISGKFDSLDKKIRDIADRQDVLSEQLNFKEAPAEKSESSLEGGKTERPFAFLNRCDSSSAGNFYQRRKASIDSADTFISGKTESCRDFIRFNR